MIDVDMIGNKFLMEFDSRPIFSFIFGAALSPSSSPFVCASDEKRRLLRASTGACDQTTERRRRKRKKKKETGIQFKDNVDCPFIETDK